MCLLIVKPAGVSIPKEYIEEAAYSNPHGSGIVWSDGTRNHVKKGAAWRHKEINQILEKIQHRPAIIHFRFATHGSRNDINTHPFPLPKGWFAAHNGIIMGVKCGADESDTRAFLRQAVAPQMRQGIMPTNEILLKAVEKAIGASNKIAFLSPSGEYSIASESSGHWKDGAWYSNYGYVSYAKTNWGSYGGKVYGDEYGDDYDYRSNKIGYSQFWQKAAQERLESRRFALRKMTCRACDAEPCRDECFYSENKILLCPECYQESIDEKAENVKKYWPVYGEEMDMNPEYAEIMDAELEEIAKQEAEEEEEWEKLMEEESAGGWRKEDGVWIQRNPQGEITVTGGQDEE